MQKVRRFKKLTKGLHIRTEIGRWKVSERPGDMGMQRTAGAMVLIADIKRGQSGFAALAGKAPDLSREKAVGRGGRRRRKYKGSGVNQKRRGTRRKK